MKFALVQLLQKFCTTFAQRETLTNVHPAAAAAVARKLCNFFSFAFHPQTSVATITYCCCCSMNAVVGKFHMKCQISCTLLEIGYTSIIYKCSGTNSSITQSFKEVRDTYLELHIHHYCHNYHNPQIAVV